VDLLEKDVKIFKEKIIYTMIYEKTPKYVNYTVRLLEFFVL
jgi:hypothetical protein